MRVQDGLAHVAVAGRPTSEGSGEALVVRSRGLQALAALTVAAAGSAVLLTLTGAHVERPTATALYRGYLVAAPMLVGLLWWRRRPESSFGPLLVGFGLVSWPLAWQGSDASLVFSLGILGSAPVAFFTFYLCLAFPSGRLQHTVDRMLLAVLAVALAGFYAASTLFSPVIGGGGVLEGCAPECPANALDVGSLPWLVDASARTVTYVGLAVTAAVFALFLRRLSTATPPQRRGLLAVGMTSLLILPASFLYYFALLILDPAPATAETIGWVLVAAYVVFPLGFLLALLQADLFAGNALRRMLAELVTHPTPRRWREVVSEALHDPSLRLGYWEPVTGRYREADGTPLAATADARRWWVEVERDGRPVAAFDTDSVLSEDPELVRAASSATLLAVEAGHLESELRASRARVLEAGDAERRRIGRDLHDSAQQRLVALRVHLSLAGEQLERPEQQALVEELGRELDMALDELRSVAGGLYPAVLAQYGIGAALRSVTRNATVPVRIDDALQKRHAQAVELAVYFSCLEAVQNATKHAGRPASITVRLSDEDGIRFSVVDDGLGFDGAAVERGTGLTNLADRIESAGGTLSVRSTPGRGTRVEGHIPA